MIAATPIAIEAISGGALQIPVTTIGSDGYTRFIQIDI